MLEWIPTQLLAVAGIIALIRILSAISFHILWTIKTYTPAFYRSYNYTKVYGEWAAVSGCTGGIGLSLVKEMARRGHNIVLISRSEEKLNSLAHELESQYKIKTKVVINDAVNRLSTQQSAKQLASLDIGILVNNVGVVGDKGIEMFHEMDVEWAPRFLTVNAGTAVIAMKYVLPNMIKAKRGIVVNMCSSSSYAPVPGMALYSASKVFLDILSRGLATELSSTGVHVQSFCPLFVQTSMTEFSNIVHKGFSISAETYGKSFMEKLGTCKRTGGHIIFDLIYGIGLLTFPDTGLLYFLYYSLFIIKKYQL